MADNYKEKIKKLLALAESDNENEAKAALLKAKELMAQHKIEEADLEDAQNKKVVRVKQSLPVARDGILGWAVCLRLLLGTFAARQLQAENGITRQEP